ncbi:dTDP-4-dehydrorhamnose 3,5-epimerase [Planctomycetota bacterium]
MKVIETELAGVLIFEPGVFSDSRGAFMETWRENSYRDAGITEKFVQDNVSFSQNRTLRGLHYQWPNPQGKLVTVLAGCVLDVAVDIRRGSANFGKWVSVELSDENHRQMYIPPGFAHGFCVVSETAVFSYKCTDYYNGPAEGGVIWNDPDLGIDWPIDEPLLSEKDLCYSQLKDIAEDKLPKTQGA